MEEENITVETAAVSSPDSYSEVIEACHILGGILILMGGVTNSRRLPSRLRKNMMSISRTT